MHDSRDEENPSGIILTFNDTLNDVNESFLSIL